MDPLHNVLLQYWKYPHFRPGQREVMQSVLEGRDTLAIFPTGAGKSLCFQVPALVRPGLCLVISPLIALMKDQVAGLRRRNITAYALLSGMSNRQMENILQVVTESNCKFLYVSPERLETTLLQQFLPVLNIQWIVVDEAHCISQWGYDFRPAYLKILSFRKSLPRVPVLALTATATPKVAEDICRCLQMDPVKVFRQPFLRPNLSFQVVQLEGKLAFLTEFIRTHPGSGVVYCRSRAATGMLQDHLEKAGIGALAYHAGLSAELRHDLQEKWVKGEVRVLSCTNAFGMGIDKPDVRWVVHWDVPECLENYYQEAGRAGRDGKPAIAVLVRDGNEAGWFETMTKQRFPPLSQIRAVFQSLVNFLQIPMGSGQGQSFPFTLETFCQRFSLGRTLVLQVLRLLQQEGWITFSETRTQPATVQFCCDKESLRTLESASKELHKLATALLRNFPGIFDQPTIVQEQKLEGNMPAERFEKGLQQLQALGILEYHPPQHGPQILFLQPRPPAEGLVIDQVQLDQRKIAFRMRSQAMLQYLDARQGCRSQRIASYFGDEGTPPCEICDLCRASANGKGNDGLP